MRTELGKIKKVSCGLNDRGWLGVTLTLGGESWGVGDFIPHANVDAIKKILNDAKVDGIEQQLEGTPIEATFDSNLLKSWRVLTEVI